MQRPPQLDFVVRRLVSAWWKVLTRSTKEWSIQVNAKRIIEGREGIFFGGYTVCFENLTVIEKCHCAIILYMLSHSNKAEIIVCVICGFRVF
jgi:hypothetical protein